MSYRTLEDGCLRILYLPGAEFDATISCTLKHVSLQPTNLPTYHTVSYSWGSEIDTTKIMVDGKEANVPRNAAEALRWLRPRDHSTRALWIDSICINQHNLEERNHQVAMMADIYRHATSNLIWLGEEDATVTLALSNVDILTSDIMARTNNLATFPLGPGPNHHLHQASGIDVKFDPQPIIRLLERPWFSRLWVVQEATLAKVNFCHCGSHTFDLIPLLRVAKWLWTKRSRIGLHEASNFRQIRRIFALAVTMFDVVDEDRGWFHQALRQGWFKKMDDTSPLFSILDMTSLFDATQLVDHVFATLGLWLRFSPAHTTVPPLLQPDYSKPISDVFRDATRYAMIESDTLALWHDLHHRPDEELPFPTWVRRWYRSFDPLCDPTSFHQGVFAHAEWFQDKYDSAPHLPDSIVLEGIFIDSAEESQVSIVSEIFSEPSFSPRFVSEVESLIRDHPRARTIEDLDIALRTVLVAAESAERDVATEDDLHGLDGLKEHFWSKDLVAPNLVQLSNDPQYITASPEIRGAGRYGEAAWRMCHLRRFFITMGGRIGLGPQTMQPGDLATVIYGCEWPVMLRRDTSGSDFYRMVGTAWIYGVMKGEAVKKHTSMHGEEADENFIIV